MVLHPRPQNLLEGIISLFFNPAVNIHALRSKLYHLCGKVTLLSKIKDREFYFKQPFLLGIVSLSMNFIFISKLGTAKPPK